MTIEWGEMGKMDFIIDHQLYFDPHQIVKSQSFSRDQLYGLVCVSVFTIQSEGMYLILKCQLATRHYSVQNKAAINPPQKATINPREEFLVNTGLSEFEPLKADIGESQKAAIPHKDNIYICLLLQFEKFLLLYPEKNSYLAWNAF
ncbi:hypothetical protein [Fluoribacter dumoffii]|uniref:Uncharacterized protein n=1 Tax=Fluoribacter dumoffii TaxID=463 RepID=A0A377G7V9_9GAMM|nr:hypothetical protein [Fluoribacter dumoffii]KTC89789.1 Legionella vir region protein [Fluoribacter dumoffii NY 23]STO20902.1 Uncharacterised protein [Fluoribacter dumoffii]